MIYYEIITAEPVKHRSFLGSPVQRLIVKFFEDDTLRVNGQRPVFSLPPVVVVPSIVVPPIIVVPPPVVVVPSPVVVVPSPIVVVEPIIISSPKATAASFKKIYIKLDFQKNII